MLIVEDQAHVFRGHSPILFAILARALHEHGCDVTVLTSRGWALADASGQQPFDVRRLGTVALAARRVAAVLKLIPRSLRRADHAASDVVMTLAARRLRRRLGNADVIVTSQGIDPYSLAAFAGGGRWLIYKFSPPGRPDRGSWPRNRRPSKAIVSIAKRRQAKRVGHGGLLRVAVSGSDVRQSWNDIAPWLEPQQIPFAAGEVLGPIADARSELGVEPDERMALLFGTLYPNKDHEVVWRAFDRLPDYRLMIAGHGAADGYRSWRAAEGPGRTPLLYDGYASEETKRLLYSAADLVVLSFQPSAHFDSGSLADAVAWGLPIVCSDQCQPGEAVARLGLGSIFVSGNADSLVEAIRAAPVALDPKTIERSRTEFSARRLAELHLQALDRL